MLKNQTAHTPGPWKAERGAAVSYSGEPYQIVSLHNGEAHYIAKVDAVKGGCMETQQKERKPRPDGKGKQKCIRCHRRSIGGMVKGHGLCPYHYAAEQWGQAWADSLYLPEHGD